MVDYDTLVESLVSSSFERVSLVVDPGSFAVRGGVVDLYPLGARLPIRIDFSGADVCLYVFNTNTQTTIRGISSYDLLLRKGGAYSGSIQEYLQDYKHLRLNDGVLFLNNRNKETITISKTEVYDNKCVINDPFLVGCAIKVNNIVYAPINKVNVDAYNKKNNYGLESFGFEKVSIGQHVVHDSFGVGVYGGMVENNSSVDAGVLIEFLDGRVVVNISNINMLSIMPVSSHPPAISSISKKGVWRRKLSSIERQAASFVDSILEQHLNRVKSTKKRVPVDKKLLRDFISGFHFIDTPDQASSWKEISMDLASPTPMDRLLCGDVGFGKTEIAVRASFYSVLSGGRVVVIAPTTVLCHQLFSSFSCRLNPFSVVCGMISRIQSKVGCKKTINDFNSNKVDVLVCTHKILSHLRDLDSVDLVIIDEEHRFGVKQKQSFVDTFPGIDILSMSATPIPRSLQKALSGIKTISTISTPPIDRLPIETVVEYYNLNSIIEHISYEINRGGQVYLLHNDIKSIASLKNLISSKSIGASSEYIHGQMTPRLIEKTINGFIEKKFDVLLSTTIIENGIDIQNVNTVIINNAHLFGLSQLHQIRGRVGRGAVQSYAYLLIPEKLHLKQDSFERLKAVEKNNSLGSGYFLSMRDLEIRGSGSLFGYSQSGGAPYGFDMYNKVLKKVLKNKDGGVVVIEDINVDVFEGRAHLPSTYIEEVGLRIDLYKKISSIESERVLGEVFNNIKDRYGDYPRPVENLYKNQLLKIMCYGLLFVSATKKGVGVEVVLLPSQKTKDTPLLVGFVDTYCGSCNVSYAFRPVSENRLSITFGFKDGSDEDIYMFLFDLLNKFRDKFTRKVL